MLTYIFIYLLPLAVRFALTDTFEIWRIGLSLFPLVVVLPSTLLPLFVKDEEREHVLRHAIYALAFSVSIGTSIRWDVVQRSYESHDWPVHLVLFSVVGMVTLWWFVISHIIENSFRSLFTHQGDITVLPLTLVAIATFVYDVPNEAFHFSRSVLFYVPIVVAWATMHFIAFNGFAASRTTTYTQRGFSFLGHSGLVVAIAHLTLIELQAKPASFIFLALVASVLSQVTFRSTDPPRLRPLRIVGMLCVQVGLSVAFGLLLTRRFDSIRVVYVNVVTGAALLSVVPTLCGNRWVVPSMLYATLAIASYIDADGRILASVRIFDIVAIAAQSFLAFQITHTVAPPVESQLTSPGAAPLDDDNTPQSKSSMCSAIFLLNNLNSIPIPSCRVHGEDTIADMMQTQVSSCPAEFAGVWWMKGNSYPMQLTTVHSHTWRQKNGKWTSTFSLRTGTRSSTLGGLFNFLGQFLCYTQVQWSVNSTWVRTPGWVVPWLRLLPSTYWLHMVREDEMVRLVFNDDGKVVWQYRMLRIVRGNGERTRFLGDFMQLYNGVPCLLW